MPTGPLNPVIQRLMADFGSDGSGTTDSELLTCFLSSRDDNALAALVRRHAVMVWGVCCRLLHNHHDAEDAFQATFLVLARKAADVPRQAVANWLYGVARQTAVRLRATAAKRGRREAQMADMHEPTVIEARDADLEPMLDEELSRLPAHYRGVIVLCDLEGMTRKEAARQLGIPEGSVASRLARARGLLAKRLTRRGVMFSGGSLATVLSAGAGAASTPHILVESTIKTASLLAAGQAEGVASVKVVALTEGVMKAMFVTKITSVLTVVLVVGLALGGAGAGFGLFTNPAAVAQTEPPKQPPAKEEKPPLVATAKGEKPLHFVEKSDMKPQLDTRLPYKVEGELSEGQLLVASKAFIADSRLPGRVRFRELLDPRYLKKHGLTDRDIAYEIGDHQGLDNYHVADDLRTVLFVVDSKGGGKELIIVRWVVYEGHLYLSPAKAPDPKTGIFKPWILRTKLIEGKQSAPPVPRDKPPEKPPHVVEKPDKKGSDPRLWKVAGEPTEEQLLVVSKNFMSLISYPHDQNDEFRFREFFDPRYLKKHGLTDRDIAFELAYSQRIVTLDVADDLRTVLCIIELQGGKKEAIILRWVDYEGHLYISPEKAPDPKTGIFKPWILRTKVN